MLTKSLFAFALAMLLPGVTALAQANDVAVERDDSDLLVEKGNWPIDWRPFAVDLRPVAAMTHIWTMPGRKDGDRVYLEVRSTDFPPVIVFARHGAFSTPFGLFVPPDGLPVDEYDRPYTITFKIDGEWVTAIEAALTGDQDLTLLIGRAGWWRANGQGFPVQRTGALGGSYRLSATVRRFD